MCLCGTGNRAQETVAQSQGCEPGGTQGGKQRLRQPCRSTAEQFHLKASSKPTSEEKDSRKIEVFIHQFQEQYAAGLT